MLELDLLFERLRFEWDELSVQEQAYALMLSECDDGDLLQWWLGMQTPPQEEVRVAVQWLQTKPPSRP